MVAPASVLLQDLRDHAPTEHFTLDWLTTNLQMQAFGAILFLLAVAAATPGIAMVAGPLLLVPALQMLLGRPTLVFPRWIAARPLRTSRLKAVLGRAIPLLRTVETIVHPRCRLPLTATKRIVGLMVILLTIRLIVSPIPLSNVLPAALIALVSLGYLEDDGIIVIVGLGASVVVIALDVAVLWNLSQMPRVGS
jgi:hypothetical protein